MSPMVSREVLYLITVNLWISGLLLAMLAIFIWRQGRLFDKVDGVMRTQATSAPTQLAAALKHLEEMTESEIDAINDRVKSLEDWRASDRRELLQTNDRAARAVDAMRLEMETQRAEIVAAVILQVNVGITEQMRRIARDETNKLLADWHQSGEG